MALDEALMDRARETGEWVLRVYSWSTPTISLGRNQTARGRYDLERIHDLGFDVVRRPTGGRAILHHREITYSVTAPCDEAGDLRQSYDRINRLLLHALQSVGVDASVFSPTARAMSPGMSPCFDEPSAGELTVAGRKLAGSAQVRDCVATHWFRYAAGRNEDNGDTCSLRTVRETFGSSDADLVELIVATTQADTFWFRSPIAR